MGEKKPIHSLQQLIYAIPMMIVWGIYLLAFWPGLMSLDSINQWGQVISGEFNDSHAPFHTITIWLLTRLYPSPAIVAAAQILALSLLAGGILAYLERQRVNRIFLWITCLVFAISPVNGMMVITLWKDIFYSTALLGLTFVFILIEQSRGKWLTNRAGAISLALIATLISLFRVNGFPVAIGSVLLLFLVYPHFWKQTLKILLSLVAMLVLVQGALFQVIGVERLPSVQLSSTALHYIAAHLKADTPLKFKERKFLRSIRPLKDDWNYNCYSVNPTTLSDKMNKSTVTNELLEIYVTAFDLSLRNPITTLNHYRCITSLIWIISDQNGYIFTIPPAYGIHIVSNSFGIDPTPLIPKLSLVLTSFAQITTHNTSWNWIIWRPAIWLYLFLVSMVILSIKQKRPRVLMIAIPIILHSLALSAVNASQDFRYQYGVYLAGLLTWSIIFSRYDFVNADAEDISTSKIIDAS